MRKTNHIKDRMRQRSVSDEILQLVLEHGDDLNRGDRIHLSVKAAKKLLSKELERRSAHHRNVRRNK